MTLVHEAIRKFESVTTRGNGSLPVARQAFGPFKVDETRQLGMTLNQFALFVAVAKCASVTKASAELRVSQPSISQQLRRLELHYGAKLYRRSSKGIEVTEAGKLFLRQVIPILEQVAKLGDALKAAQSRKVVPEILTVGGTFSASAILLPTLLARLRQRHPKAELEFRTSFSEQLERLVAASAMDLAVTDRPARSSALHSERLRREKVVVFVPPGHALARREPVKVADVLAEPLIIRGGKGISGTTEQALMRLRGQGLFAKIALRCDAPAAIKAAVRQKMGVGFAFADSVTAEIDAGEFTALKVRGFEIAAESFIIYPRNRSLSALAQEFVELLRSARATHFSSRRSNRPSAELRASRLAPEPRRKRAAATATIDR